MSLSQGFGDGWKTVMVRLSKILRNKIVLVSLSAALAACGGGGGGGSAAVASSGNASNSSAGAQPVSPAGAGTALISWEAPTAKVDGTCMSDLKSYTISYGLAPGAYDHSLTVDAEDLQSVDTGRTDECGSVRSLSYMVDNLDKASWYFAVQATDSAGNVSGFSNEAIKTIQ
jgi:hypothetical protein